MTALLLKTRDVPSKESKEETEGPLSISGIGAPIEGRHLAEKPATIGVPREKWNG